jgi:pyruvate dehydrogenase E2 component (dihydrolipoamide acetyltransferase)
VGDKVNVGDALVAIETDKASVDFEIQEEGYLAAILLPSGTNDVPLGQLIGIMVDNKEDVEKFKDFKSD